MFPGGIEKDKSRAMSQHVSLDTQVYDFTLNQY